MLQVDDIFGVCQKFLTKRIPGFLYAAFKRNINICTLYTLSLMKYIQYQNKMNMCWYRNDLLPQKFQCKDDIKKHGVTTESVHNIKKKKNFYKHMFFNSLLFYFILFFFKSCSQKRRMLINY